MQKVVWTDTIMKGGKKIEGLQMWQPESYKDGKMQSAGSEGGYYQDIAAFAIRFKGKRVLPGATQPIRLPGARRCR